MSKEYWVTIGQRLKEFWEPGQDIICLRGFKRQDSQCELCDYYPITWSHMIINSQTGECMRLGSLCVQNFRKVIEKKSEDKFLEFDKYLKAINKDNKSGVVNIKYTLAVLDKFLSRHKSLNYKTLDSILKYTNSLESEYGNRIFHKALDIWIDNEYYLNGSSGLTEKDPKKCEEDLKRKAEEEFYYSEEEYLYHSSEEDGTPEGLGADEIDWDSIDIEER